jgi:hypothetical protein
MSTLRIRSGEGVNMSDRTAELMRLCFEKVDLKGQDAVFFQNVMSALLEARSESEAQGKREEAQMWLDKWHPVEPQDIAWASHRLAMLQQYVENKNMCAMMVTKEWAEGICNIADDDPSVPLIEAQHRGASLAHLKEMARAWLQEDRGGS